MRCPGSAVAGLAVLLSAAVLLPNPVQAQAQAITLPMVIRPESRGVVNGFSSMPRASTVLERDGHYYFAALLNGTPVRMMFETGASMIALRFEDAARFGINLSNLTYSLTVRTANGLAQAAPVTIASVTVGDITRRNVLATVARPGALGVNLLGQSFLGRLAGYRQDGGRLVLMGGE